MQRSHIIGFVLAMIFLVLTVSTIPTSTIPTSPTTDYVGVVEWVIDGDTIIVDGIHIRLLDIDTPELDTSEGVDALYFMIDLVYDKEVSLFCDGWDKYDRWLCIVRIDGVNMGDLLLDDGYARVWID